MSCLGIRRLSNAKVSILHKLIYRFSKISIKILVDVSMKIITLIFYKLYGRMEKLEQPEGFAKE